MCTIIFVVQSNDLSNDIILSIYYHYIIFKDGVINTTKKLLKKLFKHRIILHNSINVT